MSRTDAATTSDSSIKSILLNFELAKNRPSYSKTFLLCIQQTIIHQPELIPALFATLKREDPTKLKNFLEFKYSDITPIFKSSF